MSEITKARIAEKTLKQRFEAEKRQEWLEVSAQAHSQVVMAVGAARAAGMTIAEIGAEYGSSDRGTIYKLLHEYENYRNLSGANDADDTARVEPLPEAENPEGYPNPYRVTLPDDVEAHVYVYNGSATMIKTPGEQYTHDLMDKTGPVWDALVQAGVIAQDKEDT